MRAPTLLLALFCAALPGTASAGAGRSGGEFLRILQSPRAVAMGESGAGTYGDLLGALALNPAALARNSYKEAAFTYNSWLEGIASQQAAYSHPLKTGVAAASVLMLGVPAVDGYDNSGLPAGQVEAGSLAAGLSYAARVTGPWKDSRSGLFAGGTLKYARERLDGVSASAPLLDAGALWVHRNPVATLALGLSAQSVGGGFKFDSASDPAPAVYRAGASVILVAAGDPVTITADAASQANGRTYYGAGAEYQVWRTLAVRGGYVSGEDLGGGFRLGGGVVLKLLQFDYSLSSYGKFGPAHRFSLSYKFDKPVEVTKHFSVEEEQARVKVDTARTRLRENRYYDAVVELNGALQLDPGNKEALELMREARSRVEESR